MVALLFAVSAITFAIFYLLPAGDPAERRAGPRASPERVEAVRRQLDLDKPKIAAPWRDSQIRRYYEDLVLHQDLGRSYQNQAEVSDLIRERLPATIQLAVGAVVVWLAIALPVGVLSALRRRSLLDRITMGATLLAISAPVYWLGLVALYLFDDTLGRFPLLPGFDAYVPASEDVLRWLESMVLPWLVLAASFAAVYARLLRSNLLEVMNEDYIRTARAKGVPERTVLYRHAMRNAILPMITIMGLQLPTLLSGALVTETVFTWPGMGRLFLDSLGYRDYPVVMGLLMFSAVLVLLGNLLADVLYAVADPRIRLD